MIGFVDRYLMRAVAMRCAAIGAIVVLILSLENVGRISADLQDCENPLALLGRITLALVPEHLSAAIPVALALAVALAVRQMALRGEWHVLAASGMSPGRKLAGPMIVATLVAGTLLADRMAWRPAGERALDATYLDIRSGRFGVPLPVGEAVALDDATTLFISGVDAEGRATGVVVSRDGQTFVAPAARMARDGSGIALTLLQGSSISRLPDGSRHSVFYDAMRIGGRPPMMGLVGNDFRHRLDRQSMSGLVGLARSATDGQERAAALAALVMRADAALFCLILPLIAMVLGMPATRGRSGIGLGLLLLVVVAHMKTAALIEDLFAPWILAAELGHLALWIGIAVGLRAMERRLGEGFVESAVERTLRFAHSVAIGLPAGRRASDTAQPATPRRPAPHRVATA